MVPGADDRRGGIGAPVEVVSETLRGCSGGDAQAQLVETAAHGVRCHAEEAGDGPEVLGADGDHPAVEVLALHLDHAEEAAQEVSLGTADRVQLGQVDGDLLVAVPRSQLAPGPSRTLGVAVAALLRSPAGPQRLASSSWGSSWSTGTS